MSDKMATTKTVRKHLADNPGWHFDDDIQLALGCTRRSLVVVLSNLTNQGFVERKGETGMRRYKLGRLPHAG